MKCPNCGKEIADDSMFCEFCGTKVKQHENHVNTAASTNPPNKSRLWSFAIVGLIIVFTTGILISNDDEKTYEERVVLEYEVIAPADIYKLTPQGEMLNAGFFYDKGVHVPGNMVRVGKDKKYLKTVDGYIESKNVKCKSPGCR